MYLHRHAFQESVSLRALCVPAHSEGPAKGPQCPYYLGGCLSKKENHLIEKLPPVLRAQLKLLCEPVSLALGDVLCEQGDMLRYAYFPVDAFISSIANIEGHPGLEVGMVGREGMLGVHIALHVGEVPFQALVQGAGLAWRVDVAPLRLLLKKSPVLERLLLQYAYVLMSQLVSSAACSRFHEIEPRLARWLLMSQDRAHADQFNVTQEFLARMLGVRRVGVTAAAGALQQRGLIAYYRGAMQVVDRAGLEVAACSCYRTDLQSYVHHLDH